MSGTKNPKRWATAGHIIQINEKLRAVLLPVEGKDKLFKYAEGHSDSSIAAEFGVGASSVQRVRMEMFGELERRIVAEANDPRMLEVIARLDELVDKHNKLVAHMSLNKIGPDVRHLACGMQIPAKAANGTLPTPATNAPPQGSAASRYPNG